VTGLETILIAVAAKVGAPLVKSILEKKIGGKAGEIGGAVIDAIAGKAGAAPEDLPKLPPGELEDAVRQVEAEAPELIELWAQGLSGQFALLQAEQKEAWYQSAWRWGWMYLLALFWVWRIMIAPYVNWHLRRLYDSAPELIDYAILLTLTGWFISLYMGGHTLKELSKNAIDAMRSWKARA